jgi:DNA-binding response OmpR family regulator
MKGQVMEPATKHRVLIVDDDPGIRRLLVAFLKRRGFELLEASNGREALVAMRAGRAEIVVIDLMMPEVSGWDVLRERETEPPLLALPMIVVTAGNVAQVEVKVADSHVWAVIGKPFDLDRLLFSVTACLASRSVVAPAAA